MLLKIQLLNQAALAISLDFLCYFFMPCVFLNMHTHVWEILLGDTSRRGQSHSLSTTNHYCFWSQACIPNRRDRALAPALMRHRCFHWERRGTPFLLLCFLLKFFFARATLLEPLLPASVGNWEMHSFVSSSVHAAPDTAWCSRSARIWNTYRGESGSCSTYGFEALWLSWRGEKDCSMYTQIFFQVCCALLHVSRAVCRIWMSLCIQGSGIGWIAFAVCKSAIEQSNSWVLPLKPQWRQCLGLLIN